MLAESAIKINRNGIGAANEDSDPFLRVSHVVTGGERRERGRAARLGDQPEYFPQPPLRVLDRAVRNQHGSLNIALDERERQFTHPPGSQ